MLRNIHAESLGPGLTFWYEISNGKRTLDLIPGMIGACIRGRAGSLTAAAREVARYKLDILGVQEVRWEKVGTVRAGDFNFFCGKGNENYQLETGILYTTE